MRPFPFFPTSTYLAALRVLLGGYMVAHGVTRIYQGTVDNFGGFFASLGLSPSIGLALAWAITINEIVAGTALAAGRFVRVISAVFAFEHLMGIILVHAPRGWFTVGHGVGGAEFSVLLLLCFLLVGSTSSRPR
jgi:putative oxidoreductase